MSLSDVQRLRAFALVREVGTALLDRRQRPLHATRTGEVLRPHVERVLAAVGGAQAALEDLRGGTRRLRLAAFTSALSSFVPAATRTSRSCTTCPACRSPRPPACSAASCWSTTSKWCCPRATGSPDATP